MPIIRSEFRPNLGLRNPHLQTILASKLVRPPAVPARMERVELDDGDFLDLAHGPESASMRKDGAVVVIFHGLGGSVASPYAAGAIRELSARGFRVVLMHWRGCSGEPNRLARSYHSGASDDIERVVGLLERRHPGCPLLALGFSLGANALLKYLGEQGNDTPLGAAVAVCPPFLLAVGATRLDSGFARVYRRHLLGPMRAQHEAKRARYPALGLPPAHDGLDSLWRFDDEITAPLHGFAGVDDYYARCSTRQFLGDIVRPTHILCARDDPFYTPEVIPEAYELSAETTLELSDHGGHVAFLGVGRAPDSERRTKALRQASERGYPTDERTGRPLFERWLAGWPIRRPRWGERWLDSHVAETLVDLAG